MDRDLTLETSPCQRTLTASGCLIEVVRLDGLTDEEVEKFVKSFPVQAICRVKLIRKIVRPCADVGGVLASGYGIA